MGAINFILQTNPVINFISGSNGPSGSINLGNFPSLTGFGLVNGNVTGITGLNNCPNLRFFDVYDSALRNGKLRIFPNISNNLHLISFNIVNNNLTGFFPDISVNTGLRLFNCGFNQLSGEISILPTLLSGFNCVGNNLTGSIPNLGLCNNLVNFFCNGNTLSGYNGTGVTNRLGEFVANSNMLQPSAVNSILAHFVAANRVVGTRILNLGGTGNFAPTGQGITDVATLKGRGWTVTTGIL